MGYSPSSAAMRCLWSLLTYFSVGYVYAIGPKDTCFGPIIWGNCHDGGPSNIQCSTYKVPLDYAHPEVGKATLALARLQATNAPRLGTLFINPGGPGGSGVQQLESLASVITTLTNGQYDVVGWDPRGFNQSTPKLTCGFESTEDLNGFFNGTIINNGIEVHGNFTDQQDIDRFFSTMEETDSILTKFGNKCAKENAEFLKYLGTTAVVRDIVSMADCLDGPNKPINYFALSYGSIIGIYLVNMFPKRVGRVVIDGILDAISWATKPSIALAPTLFHDTDAVLAGFSDLCIQAGPANCSLATEASTGQTILESIRRLIDAVYTDHKAGITNLTSFDVREAIFSDLSDPTLWDTDLVPQLLALNKTITSPRSASSTARSPRNSVKRKDLFSGHSKAIDPDLQESLASSVIPCLDSIDQPFVTTKEVYDATVQLIQQISPLFGELTISKFLFNCHRFPVRAVERFTGPFNATLSNPILVISNKFDPKTSLIGAQKIVKTLGASARLLEQDGFGHTSFSENSDCTLRTIVEFFLAGVLPPVGQVCPVNQALFPPNSTILTD